MTHIITGVKRLGSIDLVDSDNGPQLSFVEEYHVLADEIGVPHWEIMRDAVAVDADVLDKMGYNNGVQTDHLPYPGYTISRDGSCVCKSLGGEMDENNARKWTFVAQWSSKVNSGNQQQPSGEGGPQMDPEKIIPLRETLYEPATRVRTVDLQGVPYVNGAGNIYNPALSVEVELPRWDFAQFEPHYDGAVKGRYSKYADLSGSGYAELTEVDYISGTVTWHEPFTTPTVTPGKVHPPGIYYRGGAGTWVFVAPTDATTFFLNGCLNHKTFAGFKPFTLLLKVRSSKIVSFYGARRRYTEYSIVYDKQNHWDKPLNAGPWFRDAKVNKETGDEIAGEMELYPYIYYSADEESEGADLAIDETGPLGGMTARLRPSQPNAVVYDPLLPATWARFTGRDVPDGYPLGWDGQGHSKVVKQLDGNYTRRAIKPDPQIVYPHIEMVNHDVVDFSKHLRIV